MSYHSVCHTRIIIVSLYQSFTSQCCAVGRVHSAVSAGGRRAVPRLAWPVLHAPLSRIHRLPLMCAAIPVACARRACGSDSDRWRRARRAASDPRLPRARALRHARARRRRARPPAAHTRAPLLRGARPPPPPLPDSAPASTIL